MTKARKQAELRAATEAWRQVDEQLGEKLRQANEALIQYGNTVMPPRDDDIIRVQLDPFGGFASGGAVGSSDPGSMYGQMCTCPRCISARTARRQSVVTDWGGNLVFSQPQDRSGFQPAGYISDERGVTRDTLLTQLRNMNVLRDSDLRTSAYTWIPDDTPKKPVEPPQPTWHNKRKLDLD